MNDIRQMDESRLSQSFRDLQLLKLEFTNNIAHDLRLLDQAFLSLKSIAYQRSAERLMYHFHELKVKLDRFFQQNPRFDNQTDVEVISKLCNGMNQFLQFALQQKQMQSLNPEQIMQSFPDLTLQFYIEGSELSDLQRQYSYSRSLSSNHLKVHNFQEQCRQKTYMFRPQDLQQIEQQPNDQIIPEEEKTPFQSAQNVNLSQEKEIQQRQKKKLLSVVEICQQMIIAYDDKLIELAENQRRQLQDAFNKMKTDEEIQIDVLKLRKEYGHLMNIIDFQYKEMHKIFNFINQRVWNVYREQDGSVLKFTNVPGSKTISFLLQTELEKINLRNLLIAVLDNENYQNWFPNCKYCRTAKKIDIATQIFLMRSKFSLFKDRQSFMQMIVLDQIQEDGSIWAHFQSIDLDKQSLEKYQFEAFRQKGVNYLNANFLALQIMPISQEQINLTISGHIELFFQCAPHCLVNSILQRYPLLIVQNLKDYILSAFDDLDQEQNDWISDQIQHIYQKIESAQTRNQ